MTYRRLDPQKIIDTTTTLRRRIEERFPGSGLGKVANELAALATQAAARSITIQKPNWLLRGGACLLGIALAATLIVALGSIRLRHEELSLSDLIQNADALVGTSIFLVAAMVFLVSLDTRLKRQRVFRALHELRSMAHIVDMHQLTKDPETVAERAHSATASSPRRSMTSFELARYLDYASEMLSLLSKIAALYVQGFEDNQALGAVDEVEDLTSGLSRNIWQKIMILDRMAPRRDTTTG